MMGTIILWVAKRLGVTALLSSVIVYGAMALTATGTVWYFKHKYDEDKRQEGRQEVIKDATEKAAKNLADAKKASAALEATHAATEATLRRRIAALRAAENNACDLAESKVVRTGAWK